MSNCLVLLVLDPSFLYMTIDCSLYFWSLFRCFSFCDMLLIWSWFSFEKSCFRLPGWEVILYPFMLWCALAFLKGAWAVFNFCWRLYWGYWLSISNRLTLSWTTLGWTKLDLLLDSISGITYSVGMRTFIILSRMLYFLRLICLNLYLSSLLSTC